MNATPNVIVLVVDALRAKKVSAYGYDVPTTPRLDEFAARNILFRRAFTTATWTIPTHASMLSGLYLSQHRIENVKANRRFNPAIVTLPRALQRQGYRTAAFSQNRLFSPEHNFDQFAEYYGLETLFSGEERSTSSRQKRPKSRDQRRIVRYWRKMVGSRRLLDRLLNWIDQDYERPFFAFANITNVHYAWAVPPDILLSQLKLNIRHLPKSELFDPRPFDVNTGKSEITPRHREIWHKMYDAAVMHADREVGRFLRHLGKWDGFSNTIVIITSDHGEMLGDYGDIFGHTLSLHDNIMHVPMIIKHPNYSSSAQVEGVVQTLDLFTSILDWCHVLIDDMPRAQLQRPSLSTAISAPQTNGGYAFAEEDYTDSYDVRGALLGLNPQMDPGKYAKQQIAIRSKRYKFIWRSDGKHELYDMVNDSGEMNNLFGEQSVVTIGHEMQDLLKAWHTSLEIFPPVVLDQDVTTDPEVHERLKALGYLG